MTWPHPTAVRLTSRGDLSQGQGWAAVPHAPADPPPAARVRPTGPTARSLSASWVPVWAQPKYIPRFIARQAERDADVVTGSRYIRGGGVAGWDTRRKLTSCGANILAATLLQPRVRGLSVHAVPGEAAMAATANRAQCMLSLARWSWQPQQTGLCS